VSPEAKKFPNLELEKAFGIVENKLMQFCVSTYKFRVSSVLVHDGVPEGVQVGDATLAGKFVTVATTVTDWVLVVDLSSRMKRLVNVSDVVNDEAEGERLSISGVWVLCQDISGVQSVFSTWNSLEVVGESLERLHDVGGRHVIVGVVGDGVVLAEVRLVNEVPVGLEGEALSFYVVGEGGALGERMVFLVLGDGVVVSLQVMEHRNGPRQRGGVLRSEECFSLASN